jgi:hypothetical protein
MRQPDNNPIKNVVLVCVILRLTCLAHADVFFEDFDTYDPFANGAFDTGAGEYVLPLNGLGGWAPYDEGGVTDDILIVRDWGTQNFTAYPGTGADGLYWRAPRTVGYAGVAHAIGSLAAGDVISWTMNIPGFPTTSPFLHVAIGTDLADANAGNNDKFLLDIGTVSSDKLGYNGLTGDPYNGGQPGAWIEVWMTMGLGLNSVEVKARNYTREWNNDGDPGTTTLLNNGTPSAWSSIGVFSTGGLAANNLWIAFASESPTTGTAYQESVAVDQLNIVHSPTAACELVHQGGFGLAADILPDCTVDELDLLVLASDWTGCNDPADPVNCDLGGLIAGDRYTEDFEGYGEAFLGHPLADSETLNIVGKRGWVGSAVEQVSNFDADVTGNFGGPHPGVGTTGIDALVISDATYSHVAHSIDTLNVGDQITLMFNIPAVGLFGELWVGQASMVDNAVSDNNEVAMVLQLLDGPGNAIVYGAYQQQSGWTLGNPPASFGGNMAPAGPKEQAGAIAQWTEVRMTMLNLGGISTLGIDSALVETRNITETDTGNHDGSWIPVGTMNMNPQGIGGDGTGGPIYIGLGGQGAHFDNLIAGPPAPSNCVQVHAAGSAMAADLVADCKIDMHDVAALALDYGRCNNPGDPSCEMNYLPPVSFSIFGPALTNDGFAAWGDTDNDGWVDLHVFGTLWSNNAGTGLVDTGALPGGVVEGLFADFDNDGDLDVGTSSQKLFLTNSGSPSYNFTVTPGFPAVSYLNSHGGSWADYNKDGSVDLYAGGFLVGGTAYKDALILNNAGTSFSTAWETSFAYAARGITSCDFDKDGDMDIYVSNYSQPNWQPNLLWVNNGSGGFTDQAASYGVTGDATPDFPALNPYGHTIGSAWGDLDSDGDFDLFTGNLNHHDNRRADDSKFYRNDGTAFTDMSGAAGLAWKEFFASPALADYDNDGYLDLYLTTIDAGQDPVLYRNNGDWTFTDVTAEVGLSGLGTTSQAAWADFDNDGDLDLVTAGRLYLNSGSANHWLRVRLESLNSAVNRMAIGAQVRIDLGGGTFVTRQVESGTGEGCQNEPTLHFGLGDRVAPVNVEVFWPDGTTSQHNNVNVDALIVINY